MTSITKCYDAVYDLDITDAGYAVYDLYVAVAVNDRDVTIAGIANIAGYDLYITVAGVVHSFAVVIRSM